MFGRPVPTSFSALALSLVLAAPSSAQVVRGTPHQSVPEFLGYVEDELIVVLGPDARSFVTVDESARGGPRVNLPRIQTVLDQYDVRRFRRQFATAQPRPEGSRFPDLTGHYKVQIGPGVDLEAAVRAFEADPDVEDRDALALPDARRPLLPGIPQPQLPVRPVAPVGRALDRCGPGLGRNGG